MHKLQHYFFCGLNILDKIACCLLFFAIPGLIFNFDFFDLNFDNYDDRIKAAHLFVRYYSLFAAVLVSLFLLKLKYSKISYIEATLWILLFLLIPCAFHQIPSVAQTYDNIAFNGGLK